MKFIKILFPLLTLLFISSGVYSQNKALDMRCEYMETPMSIDMSSPRLMWRFAPTSQTFDQSTYHIQVATSPKLLKSGKADVWDSKVVSSDAQIIKYNGKKLDPQTKYYWSVELQNHDGKKISGNSWFETSKFSSKEWKASWITDKHDKEYLPSPLFRHDFDVDGSIASARCYISGLGYYEMYLNGNRVGNNLLDPGFTDFNKRVLYLTYDVTDMLKNGDNAIGIQLGNGWYNEQTPAVWNFHKAPWRNRPRMICEIHITYKDGRTEVVSSNENWKTSTGALLYDNLYVGSTYDARLEQAGWNKAGFNDSAWSNAVTTDAPAPIIETQKMPAIDYSDVITPVSVRKVNDTCYIFDMGKNFAGVSRLKVSGNKGTVIKMRHAELLDKDGNLEQRNINLHLRPRNAAEGTIQTDTYILKGDGKEEYFPPFTYHGFQFVEVTSSEPVELSTANLEGIVMHSDVKPLGDFECSNDLLNKIHDICNRSYLSNLFGIPTDCPHREKNGWMADGFMVQEAGMFGYDSRNVYAKWVKDMVDAQAPDGTIPGIVPTSWEWNSSWAGPIWESAIFIVPSLLYQYTGDTESMREIYSTAERYLKYLATTEKEDGLIDHGLADWLFYKAQTPTNFMSSCYYYWDNILMAQMSELTGNADKAPQYLAKAELLKKQINDKFFNPATLTYSNGTQLSYALPLYMGIAPQEYAKPLADKLYNVMKDNDFSLDFGFIGSLIVPDVLSDWGYAEAVYKMATKTTMPSWGYWIEECGATSLFETWDILRNIGDASRNHPSMGAISAWMYKSLAGINTDPTAPAFKKIIIKPNFVDGLDWVKASHESQYGEIRSKWKREGNKVILKVTIPATSSAKIVMPDRSYDVTGGNHTFTSEI